MKPLPTTSRRSFESLAERAARQALFEYLEAHRRAPERPDTYCQFPRSQA